MKRKYSEPCTEVVEVRLLGSVLEKTAIVDNGSKRSEWDWAAAKKSGFATEPEEPVTTVGSTGRKSIWDD